MNNEQSDQHNFDSLKLDNQICFPLYACSREVIKRYHPYLDELGLTYTQYLVMMVLWEHKRIGVKELGSKLFLDSGTLTPVLKSLEAKGLLVRARCRDDERMVNVALTEQGDDMKGSALKVPAGMSQSISFDEKEAAQLYELLYKLLDALSDGKRA